jgi:hypothetical protein
VPKRPNRLSHFLPGRIAPRLLVVAALGELAVGLAVLVSPGPVTELLLAATLAGVGLVVARVLGIAVIALGLTWWLARSFLHQQLKCIAPGFISYNLGVGLLFLFYALAATRPVPLSWAVALVHLLQGLTFTATVVIRHRPTRSDEAGPTIGAA